MKKRETRISYILGTKSVALPRFSLEKLLKDKLIDGVVNKLPIGEKITINNFTLKLFDNQTTILNYLIHNVYNKTNIQNGTACQNLILDPGLGKSYIAAALINALSVKTIIIVPNSYLLEQWVVLLKIVFPTLTIGEYHYRKKQDGDIIVSIYKSACSDVFKFPVSAKQLLQESQQNQQNQPEQELFINKTEEEFYNQFGLVIYDEIHEYCGKLNKCIFTKAQARCVLGLTATPTRIDNFQNLFIWQTGQLLYAKDIPNFQANDVVFKINTKIIKYTGPPEHTKHIINPANQILSVPNMINQLIADPYRNKLIINEIIKLHDLGLFVFVFSDRRAHLQILYNILKTLLGQTVIEAPELDIKDKGDEADKNDNGVKTLVGGSTKIDIQYAKEKGKIILTTYHYSGTGVSIDKMSGLVLATPRRSGMKQIVGRITRRGGDTNITRQIVDLVDNATGLKNQVYDRIKVYKTIGSEIEQEKCLYSSIVL